MLLDLPGRSWMIWDVAHQGRDLLEARRPGAGPPSDGRKAPSLAMRLAASILAWMPPFALLIASAWILWEVAGARLALPWVGLSGWPPALLPALRRLGRLISPSCGPHDRLSGLRVVPR